MMNQKSNTKATLLKYGFLTKHRLGQNFLIDDAVLSQIPEDAGVGEEDHILEIGPGIGSLTRELCERAAYVTSVEIDENLTGILQEELKQYSNFTLIREDILKTDLAQIAAMHPDCTLKVVANLPYYITTPIIMKLLESQLPLHSITIMVQKEVADRMTALPGTGDYGSLSLAVQYYASVRVMQIVPPEAFLPAPKVSSAVVRLLRYEVPPVRPADEKRMFRIIRAAFEQRRKTLVNALYNTAGTGLSKEEIAACIRAAGEPETVRGEKLSLEQFAALSDEIGAAAEKKRKEKACLDQS